jgi:homoserine/homoserine lactone efflux protein
VSSAAPPRIFLNGLLLQAANPKALLFYSALLPQFVIPSEGIIRQMVILGCSGIIGEFIVLLTYSHFAARLVRVAGGQRFTTITHRVAGSVLVIAGGRHGGHSASLRSLVTLG